jgi:hypothetical protein
MVKHHLKGRTGVQQGGDDDPGDPVHARLQYHQQQITHLEQG